MLTLAVLALPFAGIRMERAPILTPLATELVPLGVSLESPPATHFHLPSLVVAARLILGPLPSAVFAANADSGGQVQNIASPGFPDSDAIDRPHGRSPPSD